jgi:hypothetical protein
LGFEPILGRLWPGFGHFWVGFNAGFNPTVLPFDTKINKSKYKSKTKTLQIQIQNQNQKITNPKNQKITNPNTNNQFQSMKLQEFNQFHLPLKNAHKINFQIFYFLF